MGNTYFVFDRGDTAKVSECCRLAFKLTDSDIIDAKKPWTMRFSALQNVSINLPRVAYKARGSKEHLIKYLKSTMEDAFKAHKQKKEFITKVLSYGDRSPLAVLNMKLDNDTYFRINKCSYLIGIVGLNECVKAHTGNGIAESDESYMLGLEIIYEMQKFCNENAEKDGLKYVLEQTPAESTAYRFALLDIKRFDQAKSVVSGTGDSIYYTNSTHIPVSFNVSPLKRIEQEGRFHPMIEAGSITHIWLGEENPFPASIASVVKYTYDKTLNDQIAFSPEFTFCNDCYKTSRGLQSKCMYCDSNNVDGITRITGYFTKVSSWNKGKIAELNDRHRYNKNNNIGVI
jgi:ribonucleoside-triphosphate reductase